MKTTASTGPLGVESMVPSILREKSRWTEWVGYVDRGTRAGKRLHAGEARDALRRPRGASMQPPGTPWRGNWEGRLRFPALGREAGTLRFRHHRPHPHLESPAESGARSPQPSGRPHVAPPFEND